MRRKKKWVKYAGNWTQKDIPFSYAIQRWWLRNNIQKSMVTINGKWKQQPEHLISFFNPFFLNSRAIFPASLNVSKRESVISFI